MQRAKTISRGCRIKVRALPGPPTPNLHRKHVHIYVYIYNYIYMYIYTYVPIRVCIYVNIYIYMTPYEKTLTHNFKQRFLVPCVSRKTNTLTQIMNFPFSSVPEASGSLPELIGRLTCFLFCFAAVPEGFRKVSASFTGSLLGAVVLREFRKVSGRFRKTVRKGKKTFGILNRRM
jgi:hypothetical protein